MIADTRGLLEALVRSTTDAIYVKDRQGRYLLFNKAAAEVVGKPAEAVLGHDDTALFSPKEARVIMAVDRAILKAGRTRANEERLTV